MWPGNGLTPPQLTSIRALYRHAAGRNDHQRWRSILGLRVLSEHGRRRKPEIKTHLRKDRARPD
jgi:hypothetical protein